MSADAAVQLRRLLQVIPKLNDGHSHSLDSVAKLAGTDPDTLLHDLVALSNRFGDPGGFVPKLQVYVEGGDKSSVELLAPQFKRPMGLTAAELSALELGLSMLRSERPSSERGPIDGARERLQRTIAKLPREDVDAAEHHAVLDAAADAAHLAAVREAILHRRKVRLKYRAAAAQDSTGRSACPYALVAARGAWYVIAYCDDRKAIRVFRLDRVEEVKLLAGTYEVPASFSVDKMIKDGRVFSGGDHPAVRIRYSPRIARWIAERERVEPAPDGSLTVDYPLADAHWAVRHVLQYGPEAEVLSPDSVRRAVVESLRLMIGR
jgi:predicted DNA-binding transcriptional regulator YafY